MGSLQNLESDINVHLLLSTDSLAQIYVRDTLKKQCKANIESIIEVNSRATFSNMLSIINVLPFVSEKWLVVIQYNKVKGVLKQNKGILSEQTSKFLILVENYKDFKEAKDLLVSSSTTYNDLYLLNIRYKEVSYLLSDYMDKKLVEFAAKSYYSSPESIFLLRKEALSGTEFSSRKDIVDLCGLSASSVSSFALTLLKNPAPTEKGRNMIFKKNVNMLIELCEVYSPSKLRNFLVASVKDILDIKQLYMMSVIYDSLRDIPDVFDSKRLNRYSFFLPTITKGISYGAILNLYMKLKASNRWLTQQDALDFLYGYYADLYA